MLRRVLLVVTFLKLSRLAGQGRLESIFVQCWAIQVVALLWLGAQCLWRCFLSLRIRAGCFALASGRFGRLVIWPVYVVALAVTCWAMSLLKGVASMLDLRLERVQ